MLNNLINIAYEYSYSYDTSSGSGLLGGLLGGMLFIPSIIGLLVIISMWKIFTKAGKPGWASIVPIYNMVVMVEISGLSMIYVLFLFIPILNIYAIFKIYIEIAHKFGKTTGFGIGLIFLNVIFMPMLAFGDATYDGTAPTMNNNNYNDYNSNNNYNSQMNNQQPMNFDPQTGQPIVGYDPQTGQPIYGNQSQPQTNTFVNNSMNQPQTNTFVDNSMMNEQMNTSNQQNTFVQPETTVTTEPVQNTFVQPEATVTTEPVQSTFVQPEKPTTPVEPMNNASAVNIDRPNATPISNITDINNQQ